MLSLRAVVVLGLGFQQYEVLLEYPLEGLEFVRGGSYVLGSLLLEGFLGLDLVIQVASDLRNLQKITMVWGWTGWRASKNTSFERTS